MVWLFHIVVIIGVKISIILMQTFQPLKINRVEKESSISVLGICPNYQSLVSLVFWSRLGGAGGGPRRNVA